MQELKLWYQNSLLFFFLTLHDLPISGQGCSAQERPHGMWIDLPRDEVIGDRKGFQK